MQAIYEPKGRALEYSLLACNLYRGCGHGCFYCYAPTLPNMTPEKFKQPYPRIGVIEQLRRDAERWAGTSKRVLLCFTCDPYQPVEMKHRLTEQAIKILRKNQIPFQILTKAGLLPMRDFHLYGKDDAFAVTMTSLELSDQQKWEPYASPPAERIWALQEAHQKGIATWVSLEPVIDIEQSIRIIKETRDYVDLFKIGKMNHYKGDWGKIIGPEITSGQWRNFGERAVNLCMAYGKKYYVKNDLAAHLGRYQYENTDTRTVQAGQRDNR